MGRKHERSLGLGTMAFMHWLMDMGASASATGTDFAKIFRARRRGPNRLERVYSGFREPPVKCDLQQQSMAVVGRQG